MNVDPDLQSYSFHATWNLEYKLAKPFNILMTQIERHIKDETHETFKEEGLLFKSYMHMSGIGEKSKRDKIKAIESLNEAIDQIERWTESSKRDGFLAVAYALQAWIDMDKKERRLDDLRHLHSKYRNEARKPFLGTIHYIKGYSLSRLGSNRCAESIEEFQQATKQCPDNYEYLFSLAYMTRRLYGLKEKETVKEILRKVLRIKPDYLYAKVELAYSICDDGNVTGTIELLKEIITIIEDSGRITPENMKILGLVMKIYLKIDPKDADGKIKAIYDMSCKYGSSTFVAHQRALLAKNEEDWPNYRKFLGRALELDSFNIAVKLELTKTKLHRAEKQEVITTFDGILLEHEEDKVATVKILFDFGTMLSKHDKELSIRRFERAMDVALSDCKLNPNETSRRIKFHHEINFAVMFCILNLTKYYKSHINDPSVSCKLADLQYKLNNVYLARSYCKSALNKELDDIQKYKISCTLAQIQIDLSNDLDSLAKVDKMLKMIKNLAKEENELKKLEKLESNVCFKEAMIEERKSLIGCTDSGSIANGTILKKYCELAKSGHREATMRIFSALEVMDKRHSTFYETCAYLQISMEELGTGKDNMRIKLDIVLEKAAGDLKLLRDQQLEMEKASLKPWSKEYLKVLVSKIDTVMQTARNMLNNAMHTLDERYHPKRAEGQNTLDFFCVRRNFDRNQTETNVRKHLLKYNWDNVDEELITFLVEIQPCTNPKLNNWIMAFMDLNNTRKHNREAKEYETCKVYPEDDTSQNCEYQDKEYCLIDLARTVCNNIAYILDNLNGFSPRF